ncbi:hypothetical protein G3H63_01400 [Microbacterium resistens]|uniref:SdrD B-like domain-containing protein n=1 Tax=Microbacterium resistens TaxID=156977 RepID=UPI001C56BD9D|nr:SdrD B-like domain-containing protein [Microbacterium resistens]MBW1637741.1 hypothetical protein [Microbacterium resistens]
MSVARPRSSQPRLRRLGAAALAAALATAGLAGSVLVTASAASAAEQNGYVFNDAWTLTGAQQQTQYTAAGINEGRNSAVSSLPTRLGPVGISAEFVVNGDRTPGTNMLVSGENQGSYGGTAAMFYGNPTPANVPALGFLANASAGCGGDLGAREHQNFDGACDVGQLTITFDRPVTDMVMDVSGIGGFFQATGNSHSRGSFNATEWTIATPGVTLASVSPGATNLQIDSANTMRLLNSNANGNCVPAQGTGSGAIRQPDMDAAGCGSVILKGTFTSVTFNMSAAGTPYSQFPAAQYGTGSSYFANSNGGNPDGVNGSISVRTERLLLDDGATSNGNADKQRVSFRLAQLGEIGDRVWLDENRDGVRGDDEPGIAGVTVELLDADGNPVTDADGNPITVVTGDDGSYRFTDLPYGDYQLRFTDPEGRSWAPQNAGDDQTRDSDVDASGRTGAIRLDSDTPQANDVDAGLTSSPVATDDRSDGNTIGDAVTVPVLGNDEGDLDPSTVRITDPATGNPVDSVVVPGEGTWTVDPETGDITFTPEDGFEGNPTPIDYTVRDRNGNESGATVTVTYLPEASDDRSDGNRIGSSVTVPTLDNDKGDLDPSTVRITDPDGNPVDSLVVPGEGTDRFVGDGADVGQRQGRPRPLDGEDH